MLRNRVIPSLLLRNGGLVKTRKFSDPRYVGDPINAIRIFNEKEVDELIVLDIDASKQKREPNYDLIEEIAGECFMPLCYGGGIAELDQAKRLFALGVEKICLQTSVLEDFGLVSEIARQYGSQSVVVSMDLKRGLLGGYKLWSASRGSPTAHSWREFVRGSLDAGVGEILVTAVDRDGTLSGMDTAMIREVSASCRVPLIAAGGAGSLQDLKAAIDSGASAVAAGAMFVFHGPHRAVLITYPKYRELEALLGEAR